MNETTRPGMAKTLNCPLSGHWVSFRLVDEHGEGKSYAGLPYQLHDSQGQTLKGTLDSDGYARVENFYCGPVVLEISGAYQGGDQWYSILSRRDKFALPITALQAAAEQSPAGPRHPDDQTYLAARRADKEKARLFRVEVSDFVEAIGHLPDPDRSWEPRPSAMLKQNAGAAAQQLGVALTPNQHHVLEVKALRSYSPLLSQSKAFCALNAYHLAVMTTFVYAPFGKAKSSDAPYASSPPPYEIAGSIGQVLREQLPRMFRPTQFNSAQPYHLLCEEVPYSKRLEVVPYDPERYQAEAAEGWQNPEDVHFLYDEATETQAFVTHSDKLILISVRGTQELPDIGRDLDARQVPYAEGVGQAHRGFYEAFLATKGFVERYLEAFYTGEQTLMVCGHSLGGAIALLMAEWLRRSRSENTQLYTFGAPRAGDRAFVKGASALTHHRLVNHNDPVPGVPFTWMDAEWRLALLGSVVLLSAPLIGATFLLGGLLNLQGDPYEHHGEQRHFMPRKAGAKSEASVLWQPGCAALEEQTCARYAAAIDLKGDMPERVSLVRQALSAGDHSSNGGYSRAALTNLLRWNSSLERGGELFTQAEANDIRNRISKIEQELANWHPKSFTEFRWEVRRRHDPRIYNKSDLELRALYDEGITLARRLSAEQRSQLSRIEQRLMAQAMRRVTPNDVFGDLAQRSDLIELITEWRSIAEIKRAESLASVPPLKASPDAVVT
jgi:predicted lipase